MKAPTLVSFERGTCLTAPIWSCTAGNGYDWIGDLVLSSSSTIKVLC